jgi:hypothetical protein
MQQAIVTKQIPARYDHEAVVAEKLRRLANVEPNDADFLSCYLDLRAGRAACQAVLEEGAAALRPGGNGSIRLDLERSLDKARGAIDALFDADDGLPASAAVFTRGLEADCHLTVVPLDTPVEPGVSFYRVPDLTQIWIDRLRAVDFTLVLARKGGIQVLDISGEDTVSRAWASYRVDSRQAGGSGIGIPQRRFQVLRRSLAGQATTPLVIAGDGNCLDELTDALPARALKRLSDVTRVPSNLDSQSAIEFVRRRLSKRRHLADKQAAARLVRTVENHGLAVTGPTASYEALRTGAVDLMVIARGHSFDDASQCVDPGALRCDESSPAICKEYGESTLPSWDVAIELVRLACREGIPVIGASDETLQRLGGVGCLLHEPLEIEVMPHPSAQESAALDLVA